MRTRVGLLLFLLSGLWSTQFLFAFDHQHRQFDQLLKQVVVIKGHQSQVDYRLVKQEPELLDRYIRSIEAVTLGEYEGWNEPEKMAFLINAYNALTIRLILTEYPNLESIKDIGGFFSGPWKQKFFKLFGKESYLDYIEHEILRVDFKEPRIHFALVCASKACPPLRNEPFLAERLETQLEAAAFNFLQDPERNRFNQKEQRLEISSIFKWFKKDFATSAGSLEAFLAPYITSDLDLRTLIRNGDVDIKFLAYDWSLNDTQ